MNKTEIKAFRWLMKSGIKPEDIEFRGNKTPDFIIKDGKKFEVKLGLRKYKKYITIQKSQFKDLVADSNTKILIFGKEMDEPIIMNNNLYKGVCPSSALL